MTWRPAVPVFDRLYTLRRESGTTTVVAPLPAALPVPPAPAPNFDLGDPLLCYCFGVSPDTARKAALKHQLHDVAEVTKATRAGGGCGSCHPDIEDLLRDLWAEVDAKGYVVLCHELGVTPGGEEGAALDATASDAFNQLTPLQRMAQITDVLNKQVRPLLQGDGGDLHLIDVDGNKVIVNLIGACGSCSSSTLTLRGLVEERLRQYVSPALEVIAV